jgi:hypothetical protein
MHDRVVIFYGIYDATPWRGIGLHGVALAATAGQRPQLGRQHARGDRDNINNKLSKIVINSYKSLHKKAMRT